jgi:hypothetical protein
MNHDDRFLEGLRREPRPEFARALQARLRAAADAEPRAAAWLRPALAGAFTLAALAAMFAFPAVRAAAQQVLDLFRVQEFAVVRVDETRMDQLRARRPELETMLGPGVVHDREPGEARRFASIEAATAAAGFAPARPALLPARFSLDSVVVSGEGRAHVVVNTAPLRQLMDAFDVRDLGVPPGLDGQTVSMHVWPAMVQVYRSPRGGKLVLMQAPSPEVSLPAGTDLARLGEIGLRLLGLQPAEASRMARAIDWRSTLLVPVIGTATSFREVTVDGARGVYLETQKAELPGGADAGPGAVVMWSRAGRVFAVAGGLGRVEMLSVAESVH